ncbi:MAG: hypothetical protein OXU69_08160 [Gemmatimonadota bacterium]|nr:hypothetical protein [Gemmatimonadota bacterium]
MRARRGKVVVAEARWLVGIVGVLVLMLVVVLVVQQTNTSDDSSATPSSPPSGTLGPTSTVDLGSMTPREAASALFTRVMTAVEADDQAEAQLFLPMAIASYDRIAALSLDDRFHLSLLHAVGGDGAMALAVADAGLAVRPTHLLCLAAAAEAALLLGDEELARAHYRTLVDVYDAEIEAGLEEYGPQEANGHANLLPLFREQARGFLAGS